MQAKVKIGIIGGSGFYEFLKGKEILMRTLYGSPSDKVSIFEYKGQMIAFLPRHGKKHNILLIKSITEPTYTLLKN